MTDLFGALLAAAATPFPVHVQNWPTPPPPDAVALDTLKYAQWAFWATVASAIIAVVALGFGAVDYTLNIRQFRRSNLSLSVTPTALTSVEEMGGKKIHHIIPNAYSGDDRNYTFAIALQVNNSGKAAAKGCYVALWVPAALPLVFGNDWNLIDKSTRSAWGLPPGVFQCYETFVEKPIFIEHPFVLSPISFKSDDGPTDFTAYWQVFDESGKRESKRSSGLEIIVLSPPGVSR